MKMFEHYDILLNSS